MDILEFLDKNPLFSEVDVKFCLSGAVYDENMLDSLHNNINRPETSAVTAA